MKGTLFFLVRVVTSKMAKLVVGLHWLHIWSALMLASRDARLPAIMGDLLALLPFACWCPRQWWEETGGGGETRWNMSQHHTDALK